MIDLTSPQRNTVLNHTKKLGNVEFSGYIKSQVQTVQLMFSVQKYLQNHPLFYLNSLLSELKGESISVIKTRLEEEYKALVNGKSFYHMINNAIEGRRKCVNKIRRDITKSAKFLAFFPKQYPGVTEEDVAYQDWVELQGYSAVDIDESIQQSIRVISNIFVDMSRLRDMTIYLVEQVHGWRMRIEEHLDRCQQHTQIKYFFEGEPLYESLLKDTQFIWTSKLSQYIWMQCKQDPFMIRNVIVVDQREEKTALQKYFLQILYPRNDVLIDKTVECFEKLAYKFKPKLYNRFEEEELLIENYLRMQMNEHQFDEPEGVNQKNRSLDKSREKIEKDSASLKVTDESPKKQKNRLSVRGWVFEKQLKKSTRDRINDIVETHKNKMGKIKPFTIANYAQKNSIALAYLSQIKKDKKHPRIKINSAQSQDESKKFFSEGEDKAVAKKFIDRSRKRQIQSQPEPHRGKSRMFSSLTKLSPVILQDPKEHLPDTPKANSKEKPNFNNDKMDNFVSVGNKHSMHGIKINSFAGGQEEGQQTKIEVEGEQTPLNLSQFYQIFRADTNKPKKLKQSRATNKTKQSNVKQDGQLKPIQQKTEKQKLISFKELLDRSRKQRADRYRSMTHLPYVRKPLSISVRKRKLDKSKEKTIEKSNQSFKEYSKIKLENPVVTSQSSSQIKKMFLTLQTKSLPLDLVPTYVKHLESKRPPKSRIFTDFTSQNLISRLSDPFVHSIIFDIATEKQQQVGTIILSEGFGNRAGKLKYTMEYMSIQPFELISIAMLRVAEQLLSATPCLEVVYPLLLDKLDVISSQFIELIDNELSVGVQKFGQFVILQKPRPSLTGTDVRQRVYVFTSPLNMKKEYDLGLKMMGNYRSLKFDCKCIVLSSNFRLRSQSLIKNTLHRYGKIAIGELFARTLTRIMTKYHLKQLRQASFGGEGELGELVRSDPFLRSVMQAAARGLQGYSQQLITTTTFGSMEDLLNYFRYKNLDYHFNMKFLSESRFILQHELVLVEVDQELSLQFTLTSNQQLYILHNYKKQQITQITSSKLEIPAYLLPTSNEKIKLFGMSAAHYLEHTTDRLDLYTYLSIFFRNIHSEVFLNEVPSIVMPNLKRCNTKVNKVSMYDGFFKLFPEREFYSAAMMSCANFWQSFYADAVIHLPVEESLVLEFPFLLGFYDCQNKVLLTAFLYTGEEGPS